MGDLSDRLACALEGKPCGRISTMEVERVDGTLTVVKGGPPAPLCDACPEHEVEPGKRRIRHVTVVKHKRGIDG
jgi:hypothetical protein